jgi:hypothetical protein
VHQASHPAKNWYPAAIAALGLWAGSCSQVADTLVAGNMEAAAKDQIMLVRKDPASFGYRRLEAHLATYSELNVFLSQRGVPDFLAETGGRDRRYLILYYLKDREAFVSRVRAENRMALEFAGPYPITPKEFQLLDGFRSDPHKRPAKF